MEHRFNIYSTPKETHRLYVFTVFKILIGVRYVICLYIALKFCMLLSYP